LLLRLTFNPGLALTGFRTTPPWKFPQIKICVFDRMELSRVNICLTAIPRKKKELHRPFPIVFYCIIDRNSNFLLCAMKTRANELPSDWERVLVIPRFLPSLLAVDIFYKARECPSL